MSHPTQDSTSTSSTLHSLQEQAQNSSPILTQPQQLRQSQQHSPQVPFPNSQIWHDAVAGACAGAFSKTVLAPVERIKLLVQLQGSVHGIAGQSSWRVAMHVYKEEGLLAFWRGNGPNVWKSAGQSALNMSLMDYYKSLANSPIIETASQFGFYSNSSSITKSTLPDDYKDDKQRQRRKRFLVSFVSGGLAGATATTVLYPMEFMRTRLATDQGRSVQTRQYRGMWDVLVKTVHGDGIWGLYHGYGIALVGSVVFRLLFLGGYDVLKAELQLAKAREDASMTLVERFGVAQTVSLTAGTICYPIDSVRRRLMMQVGKPLNQRQYRGTIHCIQTVWKSEGVRGFFLGLGPNIVRSVGGALMLVAYDGFKAIFLSNGAGGVTPQV